jgi:hypothetical protein
VLRKLLSPPAPFSKNNSVTAKIETFKPKRVGDRVVAGNKTLEFGANGLVKYYADGRIVGEIYLPFVIVDKQTKKTQWLSTNSKWPKAYFALDECGMIKKDGRSVYRNVFIKDGKTAECLTSFELAADGRVTLSYEWTQFDSADFSLRPSTLMVMVPTATIRNTRVAVDGASKLIAGNAAGVITRAPGFKQAELFAGNPAKSIKIFSSPSCSDFHVDIREPKSLFRMAPKPGLSTLTVLVDIGRGVPGRQSANTYAGIDFKALEDLELPDYRASKNLFLNPSFEKGLQHYYLSTRYWGRKAGKESWEAKTYQVDGRTAKFGNNSLRIKTSCRKFSYNRSLTQPGNITSWGAPVTAGTYTLSFYAKGDHPGKQQIKLWVPNSPWTGNVHVPLEKALRNFSPTGDWKRYSMTFAAPKNMLIIANLSAVCSAGQGQVWIDGMQLEPGAQATAFETRPVEGLLLTSNPDNFLSSDMPFDGRLRITSAANASGRVRLEVKDFFGSRLLADVFSFRCDAWGVAEITLPFNDTFSRGIFVMKAAYTLADGRQNHEFFRFAIMDFLQNQHRLKNMFSDDYGVPSRRPDFLRVLDRWKKIGIGSKPHVYSWDKNIWDTYRSYGVEPLDAFMTSYIRPYIQGRSKLQGFALRNPPHADNGMSDDDPLIIMRDYNLDGNGEPTTAYLAKFENAVAKIAHDNPWVPMWAFGGEVFAKFPLEWWSKSGTHEDGFRNFAKLLKAFYRGVKAGNPKAKIFQDDPCNMSPAQGIAETGHLLAEVNRLGGMKFDMIGIHPYRKSPESPDLDADTSLLLNVMADNGYVDTPVFFPEGMHYGPYTIPQWGIESARWTPPAVWTAGPLSYDMGWTEKISAAWRARSWLVALKYQDRVKTLTSSSFPNNFDMDMYLTPFASQKISNTLGRLLGDSQFKKDIRFAPYVRCYVFEDAQKRPVAAVWCHHPKLDAGTMTPPQASAKFAGALAQIFDLMEDERASLPDAAGNLAFPVSSFPLFFRGKPGTLDAFIKAFDNATLISGVGISPLMISGKPASPNKLNVSLKNYLSRPFDCSLDCAGEVASVKVPASGTAQVSTRLPNPLRTDKIVRENLPVTVTSGRSQFANDISFEGFVCRKAKANITIDGDVGDWTGVPAIKFVNRVKGKGVRTVTDQDFSGSFKAVWREKGLYLCVLVKDDTFAHKAFAKTGNRWSNDCLQVYFDSFCDARSNQQRGYDENDYDYALFPNPDGKSCLTYRFRTPDPQLALATQAPRDNTVAKDIPSAFKRIDGGYAYEVFFPAKYLLPAKLAPGVALGFALFAADCDDAAAKYSHRVKSGLTLAPAGQGCYNKPHLWPVMLLGE